MKFGIGAIVSFGPHWDRQSGTVVDVGELCGVRLMGESTVIDVPRFALTQVM